MKISIVTISYNQARFLRECIDSVLNQDYQDVEYIVVDPGSTDGSREIISSYGNKIKKVFEKDGGPADGLNKGFSIANGRIFGFLNSDDLLLPGALSEVNRCFSGSSNDALLGAGFIIDENGKLLSKAAASKITPWLYAHKGVTIFQQSTFFSRDAFKRAGGFNTANRTCWDGELFLDMALSGIRFKTTQKRLGAFRYYPESISGNPNYLSAIKSDQERLFLKATGRRKARHDRFLNTIGRLSKFIIDPTYLLRRGV